MTPVFEPGQDLPGIRIVSRSEDVAAAIADLSAQGGGTILLDAAGGPYDIALSGTGRSTAPVTITARDPAAPPEIASLELVNCAGLTFRGLDFRTGTIDRKDDVIIRASHDIVLTENTMTGLADGFVDGTGSATSGDSLLFVRDSADIEISNNKISHYFHGIGILDNTGLTITGNEISHIQGDGLRGGGISASTISGNHMHSFFGSLQSINHTDMIQLWGSYTKSPNRDIVIADNVLLAGEGMATQGILILNERFGQPGPEGGYFENITITGNLVHNAAANGIYAAHVDGLRVAHNTVLWNRDAITKQADGTGGGSEAWINIRHHKNAVVENNVAGRVTVDAGLEDLHATNLFLDYTDLDRPNHVDRHIVTLMPDDLLDARNFALRADSPYHATHGAEPVLPWLEGLPPLLMAQHAVRAGHMLAVDLDAAIFGMGGQFIDPGAVDVRWHLDDGTVLSGAQATWVFDAPGRHDVRLEVTDTVGATARQNHWFDLADPVLMRIDFEDGVVDTSTRGGAVKLVGVAAPTVGRDGGVGFDLSPASRIALLRENAQLFGLDRFEIAMDLKLDADWRPGTIMELFRTLKFQIDAEGALAFSLVTDAGQYTVRSAGGAVSDAGWHSLAIRYDDSAGMLALDIDGVTHDTTAAMGTTSSQRFWNLDIGASWGTTAQVTLDDLQISTPPSAAALSALAADLSRNVADPDVGAPDVADPDVGAPDVADPDVGAPDVADPDVGTPLDEILFHFDFNGDLVDASGRDTPVHLRGGAEAALVQDGRDGGGFRLSDATSFEIDRGAHHLSGLDAFDLTFDLRLTDPGTAGGLLTLHTILNFDIRADGSLNVWLKTDAGKFTINTGRDVLADTDWHDVGISYSDAEGALSLRIDGIEQASIAASGTTPRLSHWGFALGDPWGPNVDAVIDDFRMTAPPPDVSADWLI